MMNTLDIIEKEAKSIIEICNKERLVRTDKNELREHQREIGNLIDELMKCDNCDTITDSIATITLNGITANLCQECGVEALKKGKIEKQEQKKEEKESKSSSKSTEVIKSKLSQIPRLPESVIDSLANNFNDLQEISNATVKELQNIEGLGKKRALKIKDELTKTESQQSEESNSDEDNKKEISQKSEKPEVDLDELYDEIQSETGLKKNEIRRIYKLIDGIAVPMNTGNTIQYVKKELEQSKLNVEESETEKVVTMMMNKLSKE